MIQANELRLGNWVKIRREYFVKVFGILPDWITYDTNNACRYKDVEGVPLTPEILEKWCGFAKREAVFAWYELPLEDEHTLELSYEHNGSFKAFISDRTNKTARCRLPATLSHLHHLQNLIHSLTQKELQINLL